MITRTVFFEPLTGGGAPTEPVESVAFNIPGSATFYALPAAEGQTIRARVRRYNGEISTTIGYIPIQPDFGG